MKEYFIWFNGSIVKSYSRVSSVIKFILDKNLKNNDDDVLYITDSKGNMYSDSFYNINL